MRILVVAVKSREGLPEAVIGGLAPSAANPLPTLAEVPLTDLFLG